MRHFVRVEIKLVFFVKDGIVEPASASILDVPFAPIFWQIRFSEFSVKFSMFCPSVVSL